MPSFIGLHQQSFSYVPSDMLPQLADAIASTKVGGDDSDTFQQLFDQTIDLTEYAAHKAGAANIHWNSELPDGTKASGTRVPGCWTATRV
jgi:hypothetical protein